MPELFLYDLILDLAYLGMARFIPQEVACMIWQVAKSNILQPAILQLTKSASPSVLPGSSLQNLANGGQGLTVP